MSTSDNTPPDGLPAALRKLALDTGMESTEPEPDLEKYGDPAVAEVSLGGITPRVEEPSRFRSGDLYLRLEGQISGPFRPERLESLLSSGILTGLEEVSVDLNHWTPLAYHPRIVRGQVRDLSEVHRELKRLSDLPARKDDEAFETEDIPLCAVVKRPRRPQSATCGGSITPPPLKGSRSEPLYLDSPRSPFPSGQPRAALTSAAPHAGQVADSGRIRKVHVRSTGRPSRDVCTAASVTDLEDDTEPDFNRNHPHKE